MTDDTKTWKCGELKFIFTISQEDKRKEKVYRKEERKKVGTT